MKQQSSSGPVASASSCPDSKIHETRKFFIQHGAHGDRKGHCVPLGSQAGMGGHTLTTYIFPKVHDTSAPDGGNLVLTKGLVTHPHQANAHVGMFVVKRVVTHICTGKGKTPTEGGCKQGDTVADVFKVGHCVKCPNRAIYSSTSVYDVTTQANQDFMTNCVPYAFNDAGNMKEAYKCTGNDARFAKAAITSF